MDQRTQPGHLHAAGIGRAGFAVRRFCQFRTANAFAAISAGPVMSSAMRSMKVTASGSASTATIAPRRSINSARP